jgi:hypothetical protein
MLEVLCPDALVLGSRERAVLDEMRAQLGPVRNARHGSEWKLSLHGGGS